MVIHIYLLQKLFTIFFSPFLFPLQDMPMSFLYQKHELFSKQQKNLQPLSTSMPTMLEAPGMSQSTTLQPR